MAIEHAVSRHPGGASFSKIVSLCPGFPRRTLQSRIKKRVDDGRLVRRGERRGARYFMTREAHGELEPSVAPETGPFVPLSKAGKEIQELVSRPVQMREPVGYDYTFLEEYSPNHTFYLTEAERKHLHKRGQGEMPPAPAGTYAGDILNRLLIDLPWNSSRLEGNT